MTADTDYENSAVSAELESPFLDGELAYTLSESETASANAWFEGESPFLNSHGVDEELLFDAQTSGGISDYDPELVYGLESYDLEAENEESFDDETDWAAEDHDNLDTESEFFSSALFDPIKRLLPIGLWQAAWAILTGDRDEGKLTNLIFLAKHPERNGAHLSKTEPNYNTLSREWTDIREKSVRPYLVNSAVPVPSGTYDSCTIEDRTIQAWRDRRKGTRPVSNVDALVLHQMAFSRGNDPGRYDKVGTHFIITPDGRIAQLHPATAYLWASNRFNRRSVAVEFAGNFPSTRGRWYKPEQYGRNHATPQQIAAGRCLINHLIRTLGITHVFAHRQASATRENDPGPHIWQGVAQWAIDTRGLSDGGATYTIGSGRSIPPEWRTWGSAAPVKEFFADMEAEDVIHQDGWSETELDTAAATGWDSEWPADDGQAETDDREDSTYGTESSLAWADSETVDRETEDWDTWQESDGEWQDEGAYVTATIAESAWEDGVDEEWDLVMEADVTPDAFEALDDEEFEWEVDSELWDYEFVPESVETPGGGRVRNKRDPSEKDIESVQGLQRRIPLHRLAARAWQAMVDAARADGIVSPLLLPVSGYRSFAEQTVLWKDGLKKHGTPEKTRKWVAKPGHSAHQSGRAIDLHLGGRNRSGNVASLRRTAAYAWLLQNAERFGFYPYEREPWHWEYNPPAQAGSSVGTTATPAPVMGSGSSFDRARAVRQNRRYGLELGWQRRQDEIERLLGFTNMSPSEERFAEAVADWQQRKGMGVDGIIGPNTWQKMQAALKSASPTEPFDLARAVRQNRRYGPELGWQRRQDEVERLLGFTDMSPSEERFAKAVADWQQRQGMGVDGIIGPNTWRKMQAALGAPAHSAPLTNIDHASVGPALVTLGYDYTFQAGQPVPRDILSTFQRDMRLRVNGELTAQVADCVGSLMQKLQHVSPPPSYQRHLSRFRLTSYYIAEEPAESGRRIIPVLDKNGQEIAKVDPAFFLRMSIEGQGSLLDGRLLNVVGGKSVGGRQSVGHLPAYQILIDVAKKGFKHLVRSDRIAKTGVNLKHDRVESVLAFSVTLGANLGVGYGRSHKIDQQPFRTLAADIGHYEDSDRRFRKSRGEKGLVPIGTKVFVLELANKRLPDGSRHDGWCTVNDTGSAIFGAHFDVFTGSKSWSRSEEGSLPHIGHVWFPDSEIRCPPDYDLGLKAK